jgi:hypothetical protein
MQKNWVEMAKIKRIRLKRKVLMRMIFSKTKSLSKNQRRRKRQNQKNQKPPTIQSRRFSNNKPNTHRANKATRTPNPTTATSHRT